MMNKILQIFLNDYLYVKKNPQIVMTVFLIAIIPVAFLLSGQQFLNAARENQERLEKDRIGLLQDVFTAYVFAYKDDISKIQNEISNISRHNSDIVKFIFLKADGSELRVIASLNIDEIGTIPKNQSDFRLANASPEESMIVGYAENGIRYWKSYRVTRTDDGEEYYVFTEHSLVAIDSLFAERTMTAYYWLFGTLAVVLFLVLRHIRLIDYSYLYRETKRANEMKDMFINMIAHELRAPLTAMKGYASLVRERDDVPNEAREYSTKIEDAADRLVLIVSDLLDVARIQSGKLSVTPIETNIQIVISSVLDAMQSVAREKSITLSQETPVFDLMLYIDGKRFHQALTNLVSNAIKYTKAGSISLSIDERDDRVELRVKDTGTGISAENQKNLFAPFFRVADKSVDSTVGTGLGMWITKQLVELMGGSIAVESIKGVGTHVVMTLPKVTYVKDTKALK